MLGIEPWISCLASCTLYHWTTSMNSMVLSMVHTTSWDSVLGGYRLSPWRRWSGHRLVFPLFKRLTLKAQAGCKTPPASGVQAGTDCRPSRCCAALSDTESARLGSGVDWQLFSYPGPWFIWLQLWTWVSSWASSQHRRQASGSGKKTPKCQGKLGQSKTWA